MTPPAPEALLGTPAGAGGSRPCQPFARGASGFAAYERGSRALSDALALAESEAGAASALLLCRAAVLWFLSAHLARNSGTAASEPPLERWAAMQQLPGVARALERMRAEQRALAKALLAPAFDESELASRSVRDLETGLAALRCIAFALGDPLHDDASAVRRLRATRRALRAAVLCALTALLGWGLAHALGRPNLALHQPVTVQGSDPDFAIDPARLVDGDRTNLGFHTVARGVKSVTIDLQAVQQIRRIEVYNRMDCCLDRAVPLAVEVSSDGQNFTRVAQRQRRFALWKAELSSLDARWVRLVQEGDQPFHLSEVEIY